MQAPAHADVLIAGGAAMGSSVAYHLLSDPGFRGRVVVVEPDHTYARSASALSAASIRQQFSSRVNIRISLHGIAFLRRAGELLEVDGGRPEIGLHEGGYLYLGGPEGAPVLAQNHAVQVQEGAHIALLDRAGLAERFPWLSLEGIEAGALGVSGEGWFDGWSLLQALRGKARALGAQYVTGAVAAVERDGARVTAARLADGSRIACGFLVNCAGSGGPALARAAGIEIPVRAKRRTVFAFAARDAVRGCPLLIDTTGVYVRPEGEGFICGVSPTTGEPDPDWEDRPGASDEVDWSLFEERIWPALARRVPAFEAIRPGRAWSGPYDMCALDQNAIVGPAPGLANFLLCNGFSGHGLQQAPAVGRGLAELVAHGAYRSLDLSELGYERVAAGRPLLERNVI